MEFGQGLVNNFVKYSLCPTLPAKFRLGVRREGGVVCSVALLCHQRKIMTPPPPSSVHTIFRTSDLDIDVREDVNRENNFLFYLGASPKIMTK